MTQLSFFTETVGGPSVTWVLMYTSRDNTHVHLHFLLVLVMFSNKKKDIWTKNESLSRVHDEAFSFSFSSSSSSSSSTRSDYSIIIFVSLVFIWNSLELYDHCSTIDISEMETKSTRNSNEYSTDSNQWLYNSITSSRTCKTIVKTLNRPSSSSSSRSILQMHLACMNAKLKINLKLPKHLSSSMVESLIRSSQRKSFYLDSILPNPTTTTRRKQYRSSSPSYGKSINDLIHRSLSFCGFF